MALYQGVDRPSKALETVIVPDATAVVKMASWREDYDAVMPSVEGLPDYYEEVCSGATEYRFTIVAYDDRARFARKILTVKRP